MKYIAIAVIVFQMIVQLFDVYISCVVSSAVSDRNEAKITKYCEMQITVYLGYTLINMIYCMIVEKYLGFIFYLVLTLMWLFSIGKV